MLLPTTFNLINPHIRSLGVKSNPNSFVLGLRFIKQINNLNRIHMVPPCTISESDAKLGIELLFPSLSDKDFYSLWFDSTNIQTTI